MKTYRVTIETVSEWYEYEIEAENSVVAQAQAEESAEADGWDGRGLPRIKVERLD